METDGITAEFGDIRHVNVTDADNLPQLLTLHLSNLEDSDGKGICTLCTNKKTATRYRWQRAEQEAGFLRGLRNNPACTYEIRPRPNEGQSCQQLAFRDLPVPIRESADVGTSHWLALDAPHSRPRFIGLQAAADAEQLHPSCHTTAWTAKLHCIIRCEETLSDRSRCPDS